VESGDNCQYKFNTIYTSNASRGCWSRQLPPLRHALLAPIDFCYLVILRQSELAIISIKLQGDPTMQFSYQYLSPLAARRDARKIVKHVGDRKVVGVLLTRSWGLKGLLRRHGCSSYNTGFKLRYH
jgi:hypothetical protein